MQSRRLGRTGFDVSEIGLGTRALTAVERAAARAIVVKALELGCTFFDAANEELEAMIREVAPKHAVVAGRGPKADLVWLDAEAPESAWRSGRVAGAWVIDVDAGHRAIERGAKAINVTFNILRQSVSRGALLDAAHRAGVGVVGREPLAGGLLTGKATTHDRVRKLVFLKRNGRSMAQGAIQFALANEFLSAAVPSARTVDQVVENLSAVDQVPLNEHELETIFDVTAGCES